MPAKTGCFYLPYLVSPFFALSTVILFSIAFFCPNAPTVHDLSQITISPSTEWRPPHQARAPQPNGPTVWLGIFGSCARKDKDSDITCTSMSMYPTYDFSVLPRNAPTYVLKGLPPLFKLMGSISFCLWPPLFLLITMFCFHHAWGSRYLTWLEKLLFRSPAFGLLGLFAALLGGMNFWILGLYLDRVCQHFNDFVARQGANGPKLVASRGNGLLLGYISLLLFGFPWLVLLRDASIENSKPVSDTSIEDSKPAGDNKPVGPGTNWALYSPRTVSGTPAPPYGPGAHTHGSQNISLPNVSPRIFTPVMSQSPLLVAHQSPLPQLEFGLPTPFPTQLDGTTTHGGVLPTPKSLQPTSSPR